jgi:hypothetical protein
VSIPEADRVFLEQGVATLAREIAALRTSLEKKPALLDLLPDVEIFHKSVDWALRYNEFFKPQEAATAKLHLEIGRAHV